MKFLLNFYFVRYFLVLGISAVLAWLLTPLARRAARAAGMVDQPSTRRINTVPVPRGGGVAVFIAFHASLFLADLCTEGVLLANLGSHWHPFFLLASFLLLLVGLLDDALELRPWLKLAGQIVVASLLYGAGARIGTLFWSDMPEAVNYALTMAWYIGIINAFNLIDGMDGLAAGLAIISALGLVVCLASRSQPGEALPLIALCGACLGFLRYNFHPASIFLGDCGSMFLGLVLATIPLFTGAKSTFLASVGVPLLVMGVPLFDTVLAIWRRSLRAALPVLVDNGGKTVHVMQADKEHLHHRVLARGISQRHAAWFLYGISGLMVVTAVSASFFQSRATGIVLLGFLAVALVMTRHLTNVELWDTGRALLHVVRTPTLKRLIMPLYLALDIASLVACWFFSNRLVNIPATRMHLLLPMPLFVVPIIVVLALASTYQRSWHHVRIRDYVLLVASLVAGWVLGCIIIIIFGLRFPGWSRQAVVFLLSLPFPVVGLRMAREMVGEGVMALERAKGGAQSREQILAYGGGRTFSCFRNAFNITKEWQTRNIAGIIDDDIALSGRIIDGVPILGRPADVPVLARTYHLAGIVITAALEPARRRDIARLARASGLWLKEWTWQENRVGDGVQDDMPS
jgi:UDP-N-acetylmuramyl pentapeptide phosphotransferase/UDP-N-acetylglucosamine-1-phosphate transferase